MSQAVRKKKTKSARAIWCLMWRNHHSEWTREIPQESVMYAPMTRLNLKRVRNFRPPKFYSYRLRYKTTYRRNIVAVYLAESNSGEVTEL